MTTRTPRLTDPGYDAALEAHFAPTRHRATSATVAMCSAPHRTEAEFRAAKLRAGYLSTARQGDMGGVDIDAVHAKFPGYRVVTPEEMNVSGYLAELQNDPPTLEEMACWGGESPSIPRRRDYGPTIGLALVAVPGLVGLIALLALLL